MSDAYPGTVAIVGAGLGGLATAIRLAAADYKVTVFEKQDGPGGKAFSQTLGAYRFDTGPSLFTLKPVFDDLFQSAGRRFDDYVHTNPLDILCHYFWEDGTRLESVRDPDRLATVFQDRLGEPAENLRSYLSYSQRIHDITAGIFLEQSLHEWSTLANRGFWRSFAQLHRIDALRTMASANEGFLKTEKARQFLNRYATYNGSNPYKTPATLNIIPHVEYGIGAWSVGGGIHQIPRALERLARELGVRFEYEMRVQSIVSQPVGRREYPRRVVGVDVEGSGLFPADVVISNADVTSTYQYLLQDTRAQLYKRYQKLEPSSSGMVFYWGVRKQFPQLGLHNIFFSGDYRREFDDIFVRNRTPDDPTIYVNITSKDGAPDDAPRGGENWFVLVNAPADAGQDWEGEVHRVRARVLERLSMELGHSIEDSIEVESRMLPPDIATRTDSYRGSLYGISSNSRLAAFLRHPNRSRRYRGLFMVGGSAHPGGGMPLVVLGGKIVARLVARHHPRL